jgi:hypothetical protein
MLEFDFPKKTYTSYKSETNQICNQGFRVIKFLGFNESSVESFKVSGFRGF